MELSVTTHRNAANIQYLLVLFNIKQLRFRTAKPWEDEEKFYSDLQSMLPNIPVRHWWEHKDENVAESCWKVPNIVDLKYNKYWQVRETNEYEYR